ncbi:MAG: flagellar motor switch protein FliN [Syntrophorhabdaceae bacterium]|nr:flagellar motor switch protein FliN [Syntrophorhabdaceae bacterium]
MDETTINTAQGKETMSADEAAQLAEFAAAMEEESRNREAPKEEVKKGQPTFAEVSEDGEEKRAPRDIEFLLDIPLLVSVEIGRTRMLIKDLLQLGQGSVIEFDKLVGEPMEVLVNDKLIARGEVVVVNEKFGVRLTDISSPAERLKHLNK